MLIFSRTWRLILMYAALLSLMATSIAQVGPEQNWLKPVPTRLRARLLTRLEQYVEYDRGRKYEQLYELFDQSTLMSLGAKTKDDYVKSRRESDHILNFWPRSSTCDKARIKCEITGTADWQWGNAIPTRCTTLINSTLQNGEWYLSQGLAQSDCFRGVELLTTTSPILANAPIPQKPRKRKKHLR